MLYETEQVKSRLFFYLCMVLTGCILANIILRCDRDLQAFTLPFVESGRILSSSVRQTVVYVLIQRVKQVIVVYLLYKIFPAKHVFSIGVSALLLLFGFAISCQMFYLGIAGVWFLLLCLFPHYLIYIGLLYYLSVQMAKVPETRRKKEIVLLIVIAVLLAGILCESIFSKIFLQNFNQYIGM